MISDSKTSSGSFRLAAFHQAWCICSLLTYPVSISLIEERKVILDDQGTRCDEVVISMLLLSFYRSIPKKLGRIAIGLNRISRGAGGQENSGSPTQ